MILFILQVITIHGIVTHTGTVLDGVSVLDLAILTHIMVFLTDFLITPPIILPGIIRIIPGDTTTGIIRITEVITGIIMDFMMDIMTDIIPITDRFITVRGEPLNQTAPWRPPIFRVNPLPVHTDEEYPIMPLAPAVPMRALPQRQDAAPGQP